MPRRRACPSRMRGTGFFPPVSPRAGLGLRGLGEPPGRRALRAATPRSFSLLLSCGEELRRVRCEMVTRSLLASECPESPAHPFKGRGLSQAPPNPRTMTRHASQVRSVPAIRRPERSGNRSKTYYCAKRVSFNPYGCWRSAPPSPAPTARPALFVHHRLDLPVIDAGDARAGQRPAPPQSGDEEVFFPGRRLRARRHSGGARPSTPFASSRNHQNASRS